MRDLELFLWYYLGKIRVNHRFALQKLLGRPSYYLVALGEAKNPGPPPWLHDWTSEQPFGIVVVPGAGHVSSESEKTFETILRRNDMYSGIYDATAERWRLIIRATLEVLALIAACALSYYVEWNKLDPFLTEFPTDPSPEPRRPTSDFDISHRPVAEKEQQLRTEASVEGPAEIPQQPTSAWAKIRAGRSGKD